MTRIVHRVTATVSPRDIDVVDEFLSMFARNVVVEDIPLDDRQCAGEADDDGNDGNDGNDGDDAEDVEETSYAWPDIHDQSGVFKNTSFAVVIREPRVLDGNQTVRPGEIKVAVLPAGKKGVKRPKGARHRPGDVWALTNLTSFADVDSAMLAAAKTEHFAWAERNELVRLPEGTKYHDIPEHLGSRALIEAYEAGQQRAQAAATSRG